MPAKRVIVLGRVGASADTRAVLWADVPAGNQAAYVNPAAVSAYENVSPTELAAIRGGTVAEKAVTWNWSGGGTPLTAMQTDLAAAWTAWQAEVAAVTTWADYGRWMDVSNVWQTTTGVPMCGVKDAGGDLPAFVALTGVSAFGASKFHFVLWNGYTAATGQSVAVKVRAVVVLPGTATVTGAASGPWTLQRRAGGTGPGGTGGVTVGLMDSAQSLPASITAWNAPGTVPAGGTLTPFNVFLPQPDEVKVSTLDAPTMAALAVFGGETVYSADALKPARPLVVRPGESLEVVQDATAGTGNCRILCVFTVG